MNLSTMQKNTSNGSGMLIVSKGRTGKIYNDDKHPKGKFLVYLENCKKIILSAKSFEIKGFFD